MLIPSAALEAHLSSGSAAMVHCGGGKGRAGTIIACFMCKYGLERHLVQMPAVDTPPRMSAEDSVSNQMSDQSDDHQGCYFDHSCPHPVSLS